MRQNSRVILIQDDAVALIWTNDHDEVFYCFPGGGVEPGKTREEAAVREAYEELGVRIELGPCVATYAQPAHEGYFYVATYASGDFGAGAGPEYTPGVYPGVTIRPCWIPLAELASNDVRPH